MKKQETTPTFEPVVIEAIQEAIDKTKGTDQDKRLRDPLHQFSRTAMKAVVRRI